MTGPKITVRIDQIVGVAHGLDRVALESALQAEFFAAIASHGADAFGSGVMRPNAQVRLVKGAKPGAVEVAQAVVRSVVK